MTIDMDGQNQRISCLYPIELRDDEDPWKSENKVNILVLFILFFFLFNDDERQAGAWMYSSSVHVERTNSRRTVNERLQTDDKQLTKDCRHE